MRGPTKRVQDFGGDTGLALGSTTGFSNSSRLRDRAKNLFGGLHARSYRRIWLKFSRKVRLGPT